MPIRKDWRKYYGAEWREIWRPALIARSGDRCEYCGKPNGARVLCLPHGLWLDESTGQWRAPAGTLPADLLANIDRAMMVRALVQCGGAHLDNDPTAHSLDRLAWLCRRCHILHDRGFHAETRATNKDAARPILAILGPTAATTKDVLCP